MSSNNEYNPSYRAQQKVIWLPDEVWDSLTWGESEAQEFTEAAEGYFSGGEEGESKPPPPFHGDSIAGRDSTDKIIVFKLLLPNKSYHGQDEAPSW